LPGDLHPGSREAVRGDGRCAWHARRHLGPAPGQVFRIEHNLDGERSFDNPRPGQAIQLTFRPIRSRADIRAEGELCDILPKLRDRYHHDITDGTTLLESFLHEPQRIRWPTGAAPRPISQ
jgi:hypothetical protein